MRLVSMKILFIILRDTAEYFNQVYLSYAISSCEVFFEKDIMFYEDEKSLFVKLKNFQPHIVYLNIDNTDFKLNLSIANYINHIDENIHITCGYLYATCFYMKILSEHNVNSAIIGEIENTLVELCDCLKLNKPLTSIRGLAYKDSNKNIFVNPPRECENNIDSLPFPERTPFNNTRSHYILGSRGCYNNCSFCCKNNLFATNKRPIQRFRSIDNIILELDELSKKYNCKHVVFGDSTVCDYKNPGTRLNELYSHLINKDYWMQFFIFLCPKQINLNTYIELKKLINVGLHRVFIGIEAGNYNDLQLYNKRTTIEDNQRALKLLQSLKNENDLPYYFEPEYGFMNFNPYSTFDTLKENIDFLYKTELLINPSKLLSEVLVYYGTPMAEKVLKDGLSIDDDDYGYVKYRFQNESIEKFKKELTECVSVLDYKRTENIIILLNRYIRFFGKSELTECTIKQFHEYESLASEYTYNLFYQVYGKYSDHKPENVIPFAENAKNHLNEIYCEIGKKIKMITIKLMRKGELVY